MTKPWFSVLERRQTLVLFCFCVYLLTLTSGCLCVCVCVCCCLCLLTLTDECLQCELCCCLCVCVLAFCHWWVFAVWSFFLRLSAYCHWWVFPVWNLLDCLCVFTVSDKCLQCEVCWAVCHPAGGSVDSCWSESSAVGHNPPHGEWLLF